MGKIMYMDDEFQGRIVKGGSEPVPVEQQLAGTIWSASKFNRMGILGEMPVTLSSRKSSDTEPNPYEEWLKWKKEQEREQEEKEKEMLTEEK